MKLETITYLEAKKFLSNHHYLKGLPKSTLKILGTKDTEGNVTSVIVFSKPLVSFGWKGIFYHEVNLVELSRLCIIDSCQYCASQLISKAIKQVDADAILSYADAGMGHVGKVYQASNWAYIGTTKRQVEVYLKSDPTKHSRTIYGTKTLQELKEIHKEDLAFRERNYKLKYLYIKNKKAKELLKAPILKYPKDINDIFRKYIYCWTNTITKRKYIGKTTRNVNERYSALNPLSGSNSRYFNKSILKYGKSAFSFEILEELDFSITDAELRNREHYWITKLNTLRPHGYNISNPKDDTISDSRPDMRGIARPQEVKEKMKDNWETDKRKRVVAQLVSPDGKLMNINGLLPFIESESSLSIKDKRNLEALINGQRNHVKGWRRYESDASLIPFDQWTPPLKKLDYVLTEKRKEHLQNLVKKTCKTYWLKTPEKITIKVTNLNSFSSALGLSHSNFLNLLAGRKLQAWGWTRGEETPIHLEWSENTLKNPFNILLKDIESISKLGIS